MQTELDEVKIIEPTIFKDERGFFFESFNKKKFCDELNLDINFVQDNHSRSEFGVLRGLHYQEEPFSQGKLVRVSMGRVFDVAVDIRRQSKNFGKWVGVYLCAEKNQQLWIPPGFAHGFLVLSDIAEFQYKTTDYYSPNHEKGIIFNDKDISIKWPIIETEYILNNKDLSAMDLKNVK